MHKVSDPCSVKTPFSIPVAEAGNWLPKPSAEKDQRPPEPAQLDPLYLFGCSLLWHKQGDAAAAWELIHGLHSSDQEVCVVVASLLSKRRTPRETGAAQARRILASPRSES
jgi:hypothetical protein